MFLQRHSTIDSIGVSSVELLELEQQPCPLHLIAVLHKARCFGSWRLIQRHGTCIEVGAILVPFQLPYVKDVVMNGNAKLTVESSNSDSISGRW